MNCRTRFGIRDVPVLASNLEHHDARELGDLAPSEGRAFDGCLDGLPTHRLRPAEFLDKEPVEVKLLEAVAHPAEVDGHALSVFFSSGDLRRRSLL